MKNLGFFLVLAYASFSWAVNTNIQCTDNKTGKSLSFDFRSGQANIYVCEASDDTCDSKNVEPSEQAVGISNLPGEYAPITYRVFAGNEPLALGSKFVLQFHEDASQVEIKPVGGDESRFSCSIGL